MVILGISIFDQIFTFVCICFGIGCVSSLFGGAFNG